MDQKQSLQTVDYSGIFLSCFSHYNTSCIHATKDHTLIYLYSGEYIIEENGLRTIIHPGECAFIRRDYRITMYKNHVGDEQYKRISLTFKRNLLREFYNKLRKNKIPRNVAVSEESVFRLDSRPNITSLFQSLTSYFESLVSGLENIDMVKTLIHTGE